MSPRSTRLTKLPRFAHLSEPAWRNPVTDFVAGLLNLDPLIAKQGQFQFWPIGEVGRAHPCPVAKIL